MLLQQFERLNCIGSVLSNTPRLIARFLHELMLPGIVLAVFRVYSLLSYFLLLSFDIKLTLFPSLATQVECYSCALRFYHIVYDSIDTKRVRRKLTFRSSLRGPDCAMAITVVVAKLIYGLYGEKRYVCHKLVKVTIFINAD